MSDTLTVLCPRCQREHYTPYGATKNMDARTRDTLMRFASYPALSRLDNKTYICSRCGTEEAMRDFEGMPPIPPSEWPVKAERA